jgi:hypothetical protein
VYLICGIVASKEENHDGFDELGCDLVDLGKRSGLDSLQIKPLRGTCLLWLLIYWRLGGPVGSVKHDSGRRRRCPLSFRRLGGTVDSVALDPDGRWRVH